MITFSAVIVRLDWPFSVARLDRVTVDERCFAGDRLHAVPAELNAQGSLPLAASRSAPAASGRSSWMVLLHGVRLAVNFALPVARQVQHGPRAGSYLRFPVLMLTPPISGSRSITATRLPSLAACTAAFWPAGPRPDDHDVIVVARHRRSSRSQDAPGRIAVVVQCTYHPCGLPKSSVEGAGLTSAPPRSGSIYQESGLGLAIVGNN